LPHFPDDPDFEAYPSLSGIDEVGRGCLAGPVVIASVTWSPKTAAATDWYPLLADSKQLTAEVRLELYPRILALAERVRLACIGVPLIDDLNILRATLHGFELTAPDHDAEAPLLIDGNQRPPSLPWAKTLVKGDGRVGVIAAAAVVAKVFRDALTSDFDHRLPGYGFAAHKGYATERHRRAIAALGPTAQHRKSFRPIRDLVPEHHPDDEIALARLTDPTLTLDARWQRFCHAYHRLSHRATRQAMRAFREARAGYLPSPGESRAPL